MTGICGCELRVSERSTKPPGLIYRDRYHTSSLAFFLEIGGSKDFDDVVLGGRRRAVPLTESSLPPVDLFCN